MTLSSRPLAHHCSLFAVTPAAARRQASLGRPLGSGVCLRNIGEGRVGMGRPAIGKSQNALITQKGCVAHRRTKENRRERGSSWQAADDTSKNWSKCPLAVTRYVTPRSLSCSLRFSLTLPPSLSLHLAPLDW